MRNLITALLLGSVSAEQLYSEPSIWEESTQANYNVCEDPWERLADKSNSLETFEKALQSDK